MRLTDIACQEKTLLVYALRVAGASVLVDRALPATHDLESYLTLGPERHTLAAPCEATIFETLPSDLRPIFLPLPPGRRIIESIRRNSPVDGMLRAAAARR